MKIIVIVLLCISSWGLAKNKCSCVPTTGKDYIGDVRKKSLFGFSIHWVCDYDCRTSSGVQQIVKGTYKKFYAKKEENGTEGVCEGMKYEPHYSMQRNGYIYLWDNKIRSFSPKKSSAAELNAWSEKNECD